RNDVEQMVGALWSEILGMEEIGVADNFFELGGHSLLATQIITRLRERFEINISLVHFFEAPTVAEQATIIEKLQNGEFDKSVQTITPYPRDGHLYPSFAQERVWFVQQLNPGSMSYNVQATIRFSGPLDPVIWERSLNEVVERHEIFRSSFPTVDERPIMQVHEFEYTKYPLLDLRGYPQEEREAQAQRLLAEEVAKPFDLAQLPLIRWTLLQLADEEFLMLHVESHLLHDGWSMNVFLGELMDTYRSLTDGNASPVTALPIQFADFTRWQREWLQTEEATKQLDYWKQKLAGSPPSLDLPTDHLRPPVQSHKGAVVRIELPHELCEGLRRLTRQEGMTMFITMFSAFSSLMYRYTGQRDLLIGSGIANRKTKEAERLIGMIVNNVVLRTAIDDDMSFRELLGQVRQVALEAYANQDLPFDKVVEALHPERDLSRNPLAQVIFSFHDSPINELQLPGIDVKLTEALGNGAAKFDLNVIVIPRTEQRIGRSKKEKPKGITMVLEYSTDLFEESTILRLVERYKTLLAAIVEQSELRVKELPIMTEQERQQVLVDWNNTQVDYPQLSIKELFEAQVELAPERVALVFGDQQMTYGELNRRANQLARYLRQRGVGQQDRVGLSVERSFEMIVGMLGILKAGAAYVPLDPKYPHDRLLYMMEDTQLSVLLTQEHLIATGPQHTVTTICLDADWHLMNGQSEDNLTTNVAPFDLACILYTSGSTGKPKGVLINHANVVRLFAETEAWYG
ncbi:MAG: condensation domain-containing protein, partial [Tumebacillaceae bacterium]